MQGPPRSKRGGVPFFVIGECRVQVNDEEVKHVGGLSCHGQEMRHLPVVERFALGRIPGERPVLCQGREFIFDLRCQIQRSRLGGNRLPQVGGLGEGVKQA